MNGVPPHPIEAVLKRDRAVVISALTFVVMLSWIFVLGGAGMGMSAFEMTSTEMALGPSQAPVASSGDAAPITINEGVMDDLSMAMATPADWTPGYAMLIFFMWWVMMIAMMLPSAAPMILLHASLNRRSSANTGGPTATLVFTVAYLLTWAVFSIAAASTQWALEHAGLLSPMMMNTTSMVLAGTILAFAGLYQLTSIKQACLKHCQNPVEYLSGHWKPGIAGAFSMGTRHGMYCLGCCWGLMAILFFGGIMNLYWVIGLAILVLMEKLLPFGRRQSQITGVLLLAWAATFFYRAIV